MALELELVNLIGTNQGSQFQSISVYRALVGTILTEA